MLAAAKKAPPTITMAPSVPAKLAARPMCRRVPTLKMSRTMAMSEPTNFGVSDRRWGMRVASRPHAWAKQ